jgi:[ribosomal protein S18]-alanine N-acetyltransferase
VTPEVEVRPLHEDDVGWLADLHNDAFSDHVVPAVLDASALAFYLDETNVAPELSRVAFVDGAPASFCLAAMRGDRGSVRGEGTARRYRRRGLGGLVLDSTVEAMAGAGARSVVLEAVASNGPALALYHGRGFEQRRRLLGWVFRTAELTNGARDRLREVDTDRAVEWLCEWGWSDAPWQLELESLQHLPAFALGDEAVALGKARGRRFWLYALAVAPGARRHGLGSRILRALPGERVGVPALVPDTWPDAAAFMDAMGGRRERHSQWELVRSLEVVPP